jgi:hypothetical protein
MPDPVRFKLEEARFFLELLCENRGLDPNRKYFLNSFLSAARSVEFFLRYKHQENSSFAAWIDAKMKLWVRDEELAFLVRKRDQSIHESPITTQTTATSGISNTIQFHRAADEFPVRVEQPSPEHAESRGSRLVAWSFPELGEQDVIDFCRRQLDKLEIIVAESEATFK